jgi:hypothetical protein
MSHIIQILMDNLFEKCIENYSYNSIHPLPYHGPTYIYVYIYIYMYTYIYAFYPTHLWIDMYMHINLHILRF